MTEEELRILEDDPDFEAEYDYIFLADGFGINDDRRIIDNRMRRICQKIESGNPIDLEAADGMIIALDGFMQNIRAYINQIADMIPKLTGLARQAEEKADAQNAAWPDHDAKYIDMMNRSAKQLHTAIRRLKHALDHAADIFEISGELYETLRGIRRASISGDDMRESLAKALAAARRLDAKFEYICRIYKASGIDRNDAIDRMKSADTMLNDARYKKALAKATSEREAYNALRRSINAQYAIPATPGQRRPMAMAYADLRAIVEGAYKGKTD